MRVQRNTGFGCLVALLLFLSACTGGAAPAAPASNTGATTTTVTQGEPQKGGEIIVGGSVGHMSAFMAQAGTLVVCGDAGANLGDSLYEATIYVGGKIHSLGADAQEEPMTAADIAHVAGLLERVGIRRDAAAFKRVASKRSLYHWHADAGQEY